MTPEQIEILREWHKLSVKICEWQKGRTSEGHEMSKMIEALNLLGKVLGCRLTLGDGNGNYDYRKIYLGGWNGELISDLSVKSEVVR